MLIIMTLTACAANDERYQDNASLERPPDLPAGSQMAEQAANAETDVPKLRRRKGLASDIYKVEGTGTEMKIKRSFDEAWSLLGQAIQLKDLKIPDQDRSKGNYYVYYDGGSLFGNYSLFKPGNDSTYLLKVESQGEETKITASFATKEEQAGQDSVMAKNEERPEDLSPQLLELLYDTLHDDVKDDSGL